MILFNSFWIIGVAILLAVTSYHHWLAVQEKRSLRKQFNEPSYTHFFWISVTLICIGLAGTSTRVWETAVWIIFVLISLVNVYHTTLESRNQ